MTAIALKDGILAVDSLRLSGVIDFQISVEKAIPLRSKYGVFIIAGCGTYALCLRMRNWIKTALNNRLHTNVDEFAQYIQERFPGVIPNEDATGLLVLPDGSYYVLHEHGVEGPYPGDKPASDGSAWEYLLGCMDSGKSASQSVHMACKRFSNCGGQVRLYRAGHGEIEDDHDNGDRSGVSAVWLDAGAARGRSPDDAEESPRPQRSTYVHPSGTA